MSEGTRGFGWVGYIVIAITCSTFQRKNNNIIILKIPFQKKEIFQKNLKYYLVAFTHPNNNNKK